MPGDIHLDLQRDGILPDLYFGQNLYSSIFTPYFLLTTTNPYITISDNAFFIEKNETRKITLTLPEGELWGDIYYRWWKSDEHNILIPSTLIKTWKMPDFEIK